MTYILSKFCRFAFYEIGSNNTISLPLVSNVKKPFRILFHCDNYINILFFIFSDYIAIHEICLLLNIVNHSITCTFATDEHVSS